MRATVLVIDDDKALARAMARTLEAEGHTVHVAHDGRRGLHLFEAEPPDLVVVDMVMPEMDGLEVIGAVSRSRWPVPIIAISAGGPFAGLDVLQLARRLGAQALLSKPFQFERLADLVRSLLPQEGARTEI